MQSSYYLTSQRPAGPRARQLHKVIDLSPTAGDEDPVGDSAHYDGPAEIPDSENDEGPAEVPDSENDDGPPEVPDSMGNVDDEGPDIDEQPPGSSGLLGDTDDEDRDDDPQLDVRTQEQFEEEQLTSGDDGDDDDMSDVSQTATFSDSDFEEISSKLARDQRGSVISSSGAFQHIHHRYRHYLSTLCACSDTQNLNDRMFAGLTTATVAAQKLSLRDDHSSDPYLDQAAHGLVIYVWLSVLLFSSFNWQSLGETLHVEFGSLLLCAHAVLDEGETRWKDLQLSVAYWHRQLKDKEDWLERLKAWPHYPQPYQEIDPTANEYLQKYDSEGASGFGCLVIAKECEQEHHETPIKDIAEDKTRVEAACAELIGILTYMGGDLLKAVIQGRVFQQNAIREHPVREALASLERINRQPSIYMNAIADHMGISPAPCHWTEVCEHIITLYLDHTTDACDLAVEVDQMISPLQSWPESKSLEGFRRYTDFGRSATERPRFNRYRRQMVRHFVSEMESLIQSEREQDRLHIPFKAPVVEIGYSIDSEKRLREHRNHRSSNYLMNLAEAMFQYLYPDLFPIRQAIIYACYRPMQPWLGEIMFTQIAQAYTHGGRGFSHYPPGLSNGSAHSHIPNRSWDHYLRETRADTGFQARMAQLNKETAVVSNLQALTRRKGVEWHLIEHVDTGLGLPRKVGREEGVSSDAQAP